MLVRLQGCPEQGEWNNARYENQTTVSSMTVRVSIDRFIFDYFGS